MKTTIVLIMAFAATVVLMGQRTADPAGSAGPEFKADNQLAMPTNYREWIFLSSGLGMTYGPVAETNPGRTPMFDNVFVNPAAYRAFLQSGKWPEKTMFVLEVRSSISKGSINNGGNYQSDVVAVEAEVKDSSRFAGGWAFYGFGQSGLAKPLPKTARCYSCHSEKGAVDNTFVQFYPTLLKVAKEKGTLTPAYVAGGGEGH
jgi:hypothetical protein